MGSLNNISAYLHVWQMPLVLLFLTCWLGLGPYLLVRNMASRKQWVRGSVTFLWGCKVMFLVGLVAGVCGAAVMGLVVISPLSGLFQALSALLVAFPLMTFVGLTTLSVLLHQPLGRGVAVGLGPAGFVALSAVVLMMVGYLPARAIYQRNILCGGTINHLQAICRGIENFTGTHSRLPETLEELVERNKIDREHLRSPIRPDLDVGYFYMPVPADSVQLMAVSYINPHIPGRAVMISRDGVMDVQWEDDAEWRLDKWATPEFRDALQAAEAALPPAPKP
jgi:hypothetical protein